MVRKGSWSVLGVHGKRWRGGRDGRSNHHHSSSSNRGRGKRRRRRNRQRERGRVRGGRRKRGCSGCGMAMVDKS